MKIRYEDSSYTKRPRFSATQKHKKDWHGVLNMDTALKLILVKRRNGVKRRLKMEMRELSIDSMI